MKKASRKIFAEFIWLAISFAGAVLIPWFLADGKMFSKTIEIHLPGTHIGIEAFPVWLSFFLLIAFVVYFIKEFRHSFKRALPNWIFVITGLVFVVVLTLLIKMFSQLLTSFLTIYPPVSSSAPDNMPETVLNPAALFVINCLHVVQVLKMISLLYVVFRWSTHKQSKNERPSP